MTVIWFVIAMTLHADFGTMYAEAKYEDRATCLLGLDEFRRDEKIEVLAEPEPCTEEPTP